MNGVGVIFRLNTDGSGFSKIYDFKPGTGSLPTGSLTLEGNELFGMTQMGGLNNKGVIFEINTEGTEYDTLYNFGISNSGAEPYGSLSLSGNDLYGMTSAGG